MPQPNPSDRIDVDRAVRSLIDSARGGSPEGRRSAAELVAFMRGHELVEIPLAAGAQARVCRCQYCGARVVIPHDPPGTDPFNGTAVERNCTRVSRAVAAPSP